MKKTPSPAKFHLKNSHFLKIDHGKIILWDYDLHKQFEVEISHLSRLLDYSIGASFSETIIDRNILDSGILIDREENSRWKWDWLAHIFHYGTCHPSPPDEGNTAEQLSEYAKSYASYCASIASSEPEIDLIKGGTRTLLPSPNLDAFKEIPLWEAMMNRRTCRDFSRSSVCLEDVSDLLFAAFGDQQNPDPTIPKNVYIHGYRRTSPSAGGLQCTEPYLWAMNIDGLKPGLYHYLSRHHQLETISETVPRHPIGTYLCNQHWANDMAFAVLMTCRTDKMWWKYPHSRAYRPMLMDVGHLSQTLSLCITAKGLFPWITGYFHDKELADLLRCSAEIEHPFLIVGAGKGSGSSLDRETRKEFEGKNS